MAEKAYKEFVTGGAKAIPLEEVMKRYGMEG
jgi:hypothetical protein